MELNLKVKALFSSPTIIYEGIVIDPLLLGNRQFIYYHHEDVKPIADTMREEIPITSRMPCGNVMEITSRVV